MSWARPSDRGSAVTEYRLRVVNADGAVSERSAGTSTSTSVGGLRGGAELGRLTAEGQAAAAYVAAPKSAPPAHRTA